MNLRDAISKFYDLREEARAAHHAVTDVSERRREARAILQQLQDRLRELDRDPSVTALDRQSLSARVDRQRAEVERLADREAEARAHWQPLAALVERCERFLTAGGATLEELEVGHALTGRAPGVAPGVATESQPASGGTQ